jgi:predicted DCC family thiol-disulfide oxidoreductase YuxK
LLSLARLVPRVIRNSVYRVIARNRYRWFGKRDTCRILSAEERERFLP